MTINTWLVVTNAEIEYVTISSNVKCAQKCFQSRIQKCNFEKSHRLIWTIKLQWCNWSQHVFKVKYSPSISNKKTQSCSFCSISGPCRHSHFTLLHFLNSTFICTALRGLPWHHSPVVSTHIRFQGVLMWYLQQKQLIVQNSFCTFCCADLWNYKLETILT